MNATNTHWFISPTEETKNARNVYTGMRTSGIYMCAAVFLSCVLSSGAEIIPQRKSTQIGPRCISTDYAPTGMYDSNITVLCTNKGGVVVDRALERNLKVLDEIAALKSNWNENGANAFSAGLVAKCAEIVKKLHIQPEIFPTAQDSIQFEWERDRGDYLEIEFFEDGLCKMYLQKVDGSWKTEEIDVTEIGEKLDGFVAGSL